MSHPPRASSGSRTAARVVLGIALAGAGVTHLTVARRAFRSLVPERLPRNLPLSADDVVIGSGLAEIGLGAALVALPKQRRRIAAVVAVYFVAVFPGNLSQFLNHDNAFGLDTDRKRFVRLLFQPLLVLWALLAGDIV